MIGKSQWGRGVTRMAVIGYARTSRPDGDIGSQVAVLREAGAVRVFADVGESAGRKDRPEWVHLLDYVREGDVVVVVGVARLARSAAQLAGIITMFGREGVHLRSLAEPLLDTTGAAGKVVVDLAALFTVLESTAHTEATRAGLEEARAEGRAGGRPTVITPDLLETARELRGQGHTYAHIARQLDVSKTTIRRALVGE